MNYHGSAVLIVSLAAVASMAFIIGIVPYLSGSQFYIASTTTIRRGVVTNGISSATLLAGGILTIRSGIGSGAGVASTMFILAFVFLCFSIDARNKYTHGVIVLENISFFQFHDLMVKLWPEVHLKTFGGEETALFELFNQMFEAQTEVQLYIGKYNHGPRLKTVVRSRARRPDLQAVSEMLRERLIKNFHDQIDDDSFRMDLRAFHDFDKRRTFACYLFLALVAPYVTKLLVLPS